MNHTQLDIYYFKEAIKSTETFINIGNTAFQSLYLKQKTLDLLFQNYKQGCRYGIEYLKQKPTLSSRDVKIIEEVINN